MPASGDVGNTSPKSLYRDHLPYTSESHEEAAERWNVGLVNGGRQDVGGGGLSRERHGGGGCMAVLGGFSTGTSRADFI